MFNPEDMKSCIEEWFADAFDVKEVCDTYVTIVREAEKQYEYMIDEKIEQMKEV